MKTMLIDAAHAEETRVVVLDGNRIDDFETETQGKQQLKGNIYIGEVSRVEPSLQAAFITYGGNRNGFLAFTEVHPQFFALKASEKADVLEEMAEQAARRRHLDNEGEEPESRQGASAEPREREEKPEGQGKPRHRHEGRENRRPQRPQRMGATAPEAARAEAGNEAAAEPTPAAQVAYEDAEDAAAAAKAAAMAEASDYGNTSAEDTAGKGGKRHPRGPKGGNAGHGGRGRPKRIHARNRPQRVETTAEGMVESTAEAASEAQAAPVAEAQVKPEKPARAEKNPRSNLPIHRRYRIQDVLKEGQKILVQVVKEERGSKGAALTTYFSLPGRYTVLMPNTPYAGGISRKITDPEERRALRQAYAELQVPDTMGLIIRTAGLGQDIQHIKRDYTNLQNLWSHIIKEYEANEGVQCIHEDGSVLIRALRDMMREDIEEVTISGARAYKTAKDYAKNVMPDTAHIIKQYKGDAPIFSAHKVEGKLNQLHHTRVLLPSGGYLVINPTEALVAIDINSGRNTQERNIEETAVKTNLEACEEIARQIRLRDLAGLIVVDFIDMEDFRNTRKVEQAMRKALRRDRARIQTGNISEFGLMEISRQRLRPSFGESHSITCPHCQGTGHVASPATSGLMILRRLEEEDLKGAHRVLVSTEATTAMWVLNHKRDLIRSMEEKYKYQLIFRADDTLVAPDHRLELTRVKSDGTESTNVVEVTMREQPELPPEKRYTKEGRDQRRREDEARAEHRRDRDDRSNGQGAEKQEAKADKAEPKPEQNTAHKQKEHNNRPNRHQRPERHEAPERQEQNGPRAEGKGVESKPKAEPKPRKAAPVAEDKPLEVARVVAEASTESPVIAPRPKAKIQLKKQADTDADTAPIAVAKVSTEGAVAAEPAPAKAKGKKGGATSGGILKNLLGL